MFFSFLSFPVLSSQANVIAGFEYWTNPSNPSEGYITWMVDGKQSIRLGAPAMGSDQGTNGTGVGQRLIPEEPMSIILNLGISRKFFLCFFLSVIVVVRCAYRF